MSGVRIKDLQSAKQVVEKFDEFEFVVDLPAPDSTLKLSGKELKQAVGTAKHTHPIEEVIGLPGELEKKFDKAGGTITGDLRVEGNARMKNLQIDEYLEVPELKYNRITATGNEFWVTDAGVVDDVWEDNDGIFMVTLKAKKGEPTNEAGAEASSLDYAQQGGGRRSQQTINFQFKDILRGIFYTSDEDGNPTGFQTAYYEVTGIVDQVRFDCIPLNGIAPARFMTLARQGNKTDPRRQGSVYLDGLNKFIRVNDKVTGKDIGVNNIRVQLGDLSGIDHPVFGPLQGFGALLENAYICGRLVQRNPVTGEDWVVGAVSVSGEQMFHYDETGAVKPEKIIITAKEQGFTSTPELRKWQYKNGPDWITLDTQHILTFELAHDAEIWGSRSTLTIRYIVADIYYDMITVTKIRNGDAAYTVVIDSSNGNQFLNGEMVTILTATVYKGSHDITGTVPYSAFDWIRLSDNSAGDEVWNQVHSAAGNQITVTASDVYRKAVFYCEANIP